jgi:hypothetical protein
MEKENKHKNFSRIYDIVMLGVVALAMLIVVVIAIALLKGLGGQKNAGELLSLLPLVFGIVIVMVVPKHLIATEIENHDKKILQQLLIQIEKEYETFRNDTLRVDAHLSRMVAFFLRESDPIWCIGWIFRSLKRYIRLPQNDQKNYQDFFDFAFIVIEGAKDQLYTIMRDPKLNLNEDKIHEAIYANAQVKGDEERRIVRAIKDFIDFKFLIKLEQKKNTPMLPWVILSAIEKRINDNIILLHLFIFLLNNTPRKNSEHNTNASDELYNEVLKKSDYNLKSEENKDFLFNVQLKKFFDKCASRIDSAAYCENILSKCEIDENIEQEIFNLDNLNNVIFEKYSKVILK